MTTFFDLFRRLVDQRGEPHARIADRAGVNRSTVTSIYHGHDLPSRFTLRRIALQGLELDAEHYAQIQTLWYEEEPRNHATHGREAAQAAKDA